MNLLKNIKVSTLWSSSAGQVGSSTGVAITVSTAGSSAGDSTTPSGFPIASTGLDMAGYDGVLFLATVTNVSTGVAVLKAAWSALSSTDGSSNFTDYPLAHVVSDQGSTVYQKLALEVIKPVKRYIQAVVLANATSGCAVEDIVAIQYRYDKAPTSQSTSYFAAGAYTALGTTST